MPGGHPNTKTHRLNSMKRTKTAPLTAIPLEQTAVRSKISPTMSLNQPMSAEIESFSAAC
jgi:hypothetical protein